MIVWFAISDVIFELFREFHLLDLRVGPQFGGTDPVSCEKLKANPVSRRIFLFHPVSRTMFTIHFFCIVYFSNLFVFSLRNNTSKMPYSSIVGRVSQSIVVYRSNVPRIDLNCVDYWQCNLQTWYLHKILQD